MSRQQHQLLHGTTSGDVNSASMPQGEAPNSNLHRNRSQADMTLPADPTPDPLRRHPATGFARTPKYRVCLGTTGTTANPVLKYLIPLIEIHGGEPKYMVGNPYMVGSPHTGWPGQAAGQLWGGGRGARAPVPGPAPAHPLPAPPKLAGCLATMYVGSPPCMRFPPCIWVPHHVFRSMVSGI